MKKGLRVMVMLILFCLVGGMVFGFAGGTGEPHDPYQIENWFHLDNVRNDLQASYVLNNDLDQNTGGYSDLVDTAEGWEMIGEWEMFSGSFDGNENSITGLYMNRSGELVSLFYEIDTDGSVFDLGIVDINIASGHLGAGLTIYNDGDISNVNVSGTMNIQYAGGLVAANSGNITECYTYLTINTDFSAGGLVDWNTGNITNSYTVSVINPGNVGAGFVRSNDGGEISNSYSIVQMEGTGTLSGFVYANNGTINNSFWDMERSGISVGVIEGSEVGISGKTTAEMQDQLTFTAWDFSDTWELSEPNSSMQGYPILQWQEGYTSILDWHQY